MRSIALALFALAALAPAQDPAAGVPDFAKLERAFTEARDAWNLARRDASRDGDREELTRLNSARPEAEFLPKFQAAAQALEGQDDAVPFLVWIVQHGDTDSAKAAMTTLMASHAAHPGIRLAVARLGGLHSRFGLEQTRAWLDAVLEQNEDPSVLAQAHFTRAGLYVGTRAAAHSDELRQLAVEDLEYAVEHADSDSLRGLAERLLDEATRLEPGLPAPEIEGEDLDGVPFKLSDYRGKVILLDFWGDW